VTFSAAMVLLLFCFCVGFVSADWQSVASLSSEFIVGIQDGRGAAADIQSVIQKQIYLYENIDGTILAAAVAAKIVSLTRSKYDYLIEMRTVVEEYIANSSSSVPTPSPSPSPSPSSSSLGFVFTGSYDSTQFNVTLNQNLDESEDLLPLWASIYATNPNIKMMYYSGSSGMIRGLSASSTLNTLYSSTPPSTFTDSRTLPSYVYSTTLAKDIVFLLDFTDLSSEWIAQIKSSMKEIVNGLYDSDYAQLLIASVNDGVNCSSSHLIRMTEENKVFLLSTIDQINTTILYPSSGNITQLFSDAFDILEAARASTTNSHSHCQPIFFFISHQQPSDSLNSYITTRNNDFNVQILTLAIQSALNSAGYLGGGNIYDLSCDNDGIWFDIESTSDLTPKMLQYLLTLQRSRIVEEPVFFIRFPSFGPPDDGILIIGSIPVYSDNIVHGVITIEFTFSDIQSYVFAQSRGISFTFLTTNHGDLLLHPQYRLPSTVTNLPIYYDCAMIETADLFIELVRGPLVEVYTGQVQVTINRPLPKGDVGTEGVKSVPVKTTFFWSRVNSLPFIVVMAFSDAELRSTQLWPTQYATWVLSSRSQLILNQSDWQDFLPADYEADLEYYSSGDVFSYKYVTAIDNLRVFNDELTQIALDSYNSTLGEYNVGSEMLSPQLNKQLLTVLNSLETTYNENPGLLDQPRQYARIMSQISPIWAADHNQLCLTFPDCRVVQRYTGFYNLMMITYPGYVQQHIGRHPNYLCRYRPWYLRAESSPGLTTVSTPYLDAFFGGKVITISRSVFDDPSREVDDREILGVVGVDYPYNTFYDQYIEATGCAPNRSAVTSSVPMCYLMDVSALVILTPDFLKDTYTTIDSTSSDTESIVIAEPEIARDLYDKGAIYLNSFTNFNSYNLVITYDDDGNVVTVERILIDTPQSIPLYAVNDTVLRLAGSISGTLSKGPGLCTSGSYTVTPIEGTSLYLIYIEDYSRDESPICNSTQFEDLNVRNITFSACSTDLVEYPHSPVDCPNADKRETLTEENRPYSAKCSLVPPPEIDYVNWDDPVVIAFVVLTGILMILTLIIWAMIFKYRNTPVIKMASPTFIYIQFFGFMLGYSNIFLWSGKPTAVQCGLRPWFMSLAFVLIVGPMFAKTYRIWKVFSGKGFFAPKISDRIVLMYVLAMMVPPIIVCIIWCAYEIPSPMLKDDSFSNDKVVYRCDGDSCRIFEGVLIGYCGFLLVLGTFFAFQSRKATSYFNEARFIGVSIYSITFCGIVGVVLTYVLLGLPLAYYVVYCVSGLLGIVGTIIIVYFPKLRICIFKPEKNIATHRGTNSTSSS
jgi:hypothetical protein